MQKDKKSLSSLCIAVGLILFVWHLQLPTSIQAFLFLPWVGYALLIVGVFGILMGKEKWDYGEKKIWIPMLAIAVSIALSGVEAFVERRMVFGEMVGAISVSVLFFGLYLSARKLGSDIFKFMPLAVVLESISVPIVSAIKGWQPTGGLLSFSNYDIATGLIIFGVLVSPVKKQWWLSSIAMVGLWFSGSGEAILAGGILLIVALIRRDWGKKMWLPAMVLATAVIISFTSGIAWSVQNPMLSRIQLFADRNTSAYSLIEANPFLREPGETQNGLSIADGTSKSSVIDRVFGFRLSHIGLTMPIKPFGYGINLSKFYWGIPHNVVLIIIEQVGIVAMLCWLWVVGWSIKNTPMKYAVISLIVLGLVDHYIFTEAMPWMPSLIGAASVATVKSDLIFKEAA